MRIFITGVAGFLGSHLADWFMARGAEVVGCDNFFGGERANIPVGVRFHEHDITVLDGYADLMKGCDVVYHCAAAAYEGVSVFAPGFICDNIFSGSVNTFSAAIKAGVKRIVNCSSMARYGAIAPPFRENDTPKPQDPYGIAKLSAEHVLKNLASTHGFEWVIAVPHNIYGPRQRYCDPYRNVASIMANLMLQGRQPIIYGDGSQMRCFSYIDDVVGCLGKMATETDVVGHVINIGPDEDPVTVLELAQKLAKIIDFKLDPIFMPGRPQEVHHATCSAELSRYLLGYKTQVFLDEGLGYLVDAIRKRGPKPFDYHFDVEFVTSKTPKTWTDRLF